MNEIKNRWTGEVICSGESVRAVVLANLKILYAADLLGADLGDADLRGAYLRIADLRGADLGDADLRDADLGGADLRGADLGNADLRDADLYDADLRGAYLRGADLRGAKSDWRSHDFLSEVLRRAAGDDIAKLKVAGLVLICREKCWKDFAEIAARDPLGDWALDTLADFLTDGDEAPDILVTRKRKLLDAPSVKRRHRNT